MICVILFSIAHILSLQDPEIRVIVQLMEESETKPKWEKISSYSPAVKVYWGQWKSLEIINGKTLLMLRRDTARGKV